MEKKKTAKRDIMESAGTWKMSDKEAEFIIKCIMSYRYVQKPRY